MNDIIMGQFKHWSIEQDDQNTLWATLDRADKSTNTLNEAVMREFEQILNSVAQNQQIKAMVIRSGKDNGFIAGADIEQFKAFKNAQEATKLIRTGQDIFNKLEALPQKTIAQIEGFCMGGGLELALSCDYRIVLNDSKTRLGLPEVKLGIQPGWGGTVRLPDLIGPLKAMDLILSGRTLRAKQAKKMGMVDEALPARLLRQAVDHYVQKKPKHRKKDFKHYRNWVLNSVALRLPLSKLFEYQVNKKAKKEHYPAPYKIISNWREHGTKRPEALDKEAESIGELLVSSTSQNLVKVFFLQEKMKGLAKKNAFKPKHVHVIGAGVMGGDIAAWCAVKGYHVTIEDQSLSIIADCVKRTYKLAKKRLKEKHLITAAIDRLLPDPQGEGVGRADVIIEAITEKLEAKQGLFKKLEARAKPDAVLASNTSTIPLEEIANALKDPTRLVGIHFFNPVALLPLVEVVVSDKTAPEVVQRALGFVGAIDKLPIEVKSAPGFLVNRVLMPYMIEAVHLLEEGVPGPTIDKAAKKFGMPMGPIELGDVVGLDVCLAAAEKLSHHFGITVPDKIRDLVQQGRLGKKSGQGFYTWKKGKAQKEKSKTEEVPDDISDRLIMRMLNESIACLREGIVEDEDYLDAGSIFGFGFPPFRGGILHYAQSEGFEHIFEQLNELENRYGKRFAPDKGWNEVA